MQTTSSNACLARLQVARALANLCRVMTNQRSILIHKYLWSTYAILGLSTDPIEQEVATNFYLYVSENGTSGAVVQ